MKKLVTIFGTLAISLSAIAQNSSAADGLILERSKPNKDREYIVRTTTPAWVQTMYSLCDEGDKVLSGGCAGGQNIIVAKSTEIDGGWFCGFRYFEEYTVDSEKAFSIGLVVSGEAADKNMRTESIVLCEKHR